MDVDDFADATGAGLVVGATGGIGSAVVRVLAQRGCDVALTWHADEATARSLADQVGVYGVRVSTHRLDVTAAGECARVVAEVEERHRGLHTVVYAVDSGAARAHLADIAPARMAEHLLTDVVGFLDVVSHALPALRRSRGSVVAVTTAMTARYLAREVTAAVPLAAVETMVRALAHEEGRFGVRANCVGAGMLHDAGADLMVDRGLIDERGLEVARAHIPLDRFGLAHDVAEAVCFLASPRAAFISGQKLDVDGGFGV